MWTKRFWTIGLASCLWGIAQAQAPYYSTRIDSIDGKDAVANSINNQEVVVGRWVNSANEVYAFAYRREPFLGVNFRTYPPPAGRSSTLRSIADNNRAAGWAHDAGQNKRPAYINNVLSGGGWVTLGTSGNPGGSIFDHDGGDRLVGEVIQANGTSLGAIWTSSSSGANPAHLTSRVGAWQALNMASSRRAVGWRKNSSNTGDEAMWADTNIGSITVRSLPMSGYTEGRAYGINDYHFVVGQVKNSAGRWFPCIWVWNGSSYGNAIPLPTPTGGSNTDGFAVAWAISNGPPQLGGHGVVVGSADNGFGTKVASRWQWFDPYQFENLSDTAAGYTAGLRVFTEALAINNASTGVYSNQGVGETIVGRGRPTPGGSAFEAVFAADAIDETQPPEIIVPPGNSGPVTGQANRTIGSVERVVPGGYSTAPWTIEPGVTPNQTLTGVFRYKPFGVVSGGGSRFMMMESQPVLFKMFPEWASSIIQFQPSSVLISSPGGPDNVLGIDRTPPITLNVSQAWQVAGLNLALSVEYQEANSLIMEVQVLQNRSALDQASATRAAHPGSSTLRARLSRTTPFGVLSGRAIEFRVTYPSGVMNTVVGTTDANGVAQVAAPVPANSGTGRAQVAIHFLGDPANVIPGHLPSSTTTSFAVTGNTVRRGP